MSSPVCRLSLKNFRNVLLLIHKQPYFFIFKIKNIEIYVFRPFLYIEACFSFLMLKNTLNGWNKFNTYCKSIVCKNIKSSRILL